MFRRDQILFVEKDSESYRSDPVLAGGLWLRRCAQRPNYLINYFKGKYGALPYIDFAGLLEQPAEEAKP
jgi:hypothetical protein